MSSEFERRSSEFSVDVIEVDHAYTSPCNENKTLPYNFNDDTSTLASTNDSIFISSTDHNDIELAIKSTAFPLQNIGQSKRGSNQNPGNISVEHSSDVLFGSKTFFTGPVVIKQFIAESDAANVNQKDEYSDVPDTSQISNDRAIKSG